MSSEQLGGAEHFQPAALQLLGNIAGRAAEHFFEVAATVGGLIAAVMVGRAYLQKRTHGGGSHE